MHRFPVHPAVQIDATDDVPPLIGAADLQRAPHGATQLHEIVGLQEHVGELGVRDPVTVQTTLDRVTPEHGVEREVLADVAEELDGGQVTGPLHVVDHPRAHGPLGEVHEELELTGDALGPLGHGVRGVHGALPDLAGVADHPCRSPGQHDRPVPGQLEPPQGEKRDQVTCVQARTGGIEAAVQRHGALVEMGTERVEVGRLRDEPPPLQVFEDVGSHACHCSPSTRWATTGRGASPSAREDCAGRRRPPGRPPARTARGVPPHGRHPPWGRTGSATRVPDRDGR